MTEISYCTKHSIWSIKTSGTIPNTGNDNSMSRSFFKKKLGNSFKFLGILKKKSVKPSNLIFKTRKWTSIQYYLFKYNPSSNFTILHVCKYSHTYTYMYTYINRHVLLSISCILQILVNHLPITTVIIKNCRMSLRIPQETI